MINFGQITVPVGNITYNIVIIVYYKVYEIIVYQPFADNIPAPSCTCISKVFSERFRDKKKKKKDKIRL